MKWQIYPPVDLPVDRNGNFRFLLSELILADQLADLPPILASSFHISTVRALDRPRGVLCERPFTHEGNYLVNLLTRCLQTTHTLRSCTIMDRLVIPKTLRKTFTSRSFGIMGPVLWNRLPNSVKDSGNIDICKKKLKEISIY